MGEEPNISINLGDLQETNICHLSSVVTKQMGLTFQRAVSYKKPNEEYSHLKDLWYPESKYIRCVGRANFKNKQTFYCSEIPGIALFETKTQRRRRKDWIDNF